MSNNEQKFIDPMVIEESAEALDAKKEKWMKICGEIFDLYPEMTDTIMELYDQDKGKLLEKMSTIFDDPDVE